MCRGLVAIDIRAHCVQFYEECKPAQETGLNGLGDWLKW